MSKINVTIIIKEHIRTQFTGGFADYLLFLVIPTLVSGTGLYYEVDLESQIGLIVSSLSIFIGLFLNVLVLLFDMLRRNHSRDLKIKGLKELIANISFSILLSGFLILVLVSTKIDHLIINSIFKFLAFYFLIWLLLIIMMILKRIFVLFTDEVNEIEKINKEKNNVEKPGQGEEE